MTIRPEQVAKKETGEGTEERDILKTTLGFDSPARGENGLWHASAKESPRSSGLNTILTTKPEISTIGISALSVPLKSQQTVLFM